MTTARHVRAHCASLEQALRYPPGQGYTIVEIAADLGVTPEEARAYRRNLGRALRWIEKNELPDLPDILNYWRDGARWRYDVIPEVRAAAGRRGLI